MTTPENSSHNPYATGESWFWPPDGILDGSNFDVAQRWVDGARADMLFRATDESMGAESMAQHAAVRQELESLIDDHEARLKAGDEGLAALLAHRLELEVDELNRGERTTIVGQAHLLAERLQQVGHIYYVPRPDSPPANS